MNYDEFVNWSYEHCPVEIDMDEFHQFLACSNANLINEFAKKLNCTVDEILGQITTDWTCFDSAV